MRGLFIRDIDSEDLTCDPPEIERQIDENVHVSEGSEISIKVLRSIICETCESVTV